MFCFIASWIGAVEPFTFGSLFLCCTFVVFADHGLTYPSEASPDMHDFQCPCEAGFECRGTVVHHYENSHVHENPICQTPEDEETLSLEWYVLYTNTLRINVLWHTCTRICTVRLNALWYTCTRICTVRLNVLWYTCTRICTVRLNVLWHTCTRICTVRLNVLWYTCTRICTVRLDWMFFDTHVHEYVE